MEFFPAHFQVKDLKTGVQLLQGRTKDELYEWPVNPPKPSSHFTTTTPKTDLTSWHSRLGHPSLSTLKVVVSQFSLPVSNSLQKQFNCSDCLLNKTHKLPFHTNTITSTQPLEYLYIDLWTSPIVSIDNFKYYLVIVDHYTRYSWFYPIKQKSHVKDVFMTFKALVANKFQRKIIHLYSDNGGEFIALRSFLSSNGITHLTTPPHTPEHNGISERKHRHIVETGLTLLGQASMPKSYWSYAFTIAIYLINRMSSDVIGGISPYKRLFGQAPNYLKLRVFGCLCFPWLRPYTTHKLDDRPAPCVFLGYSQTQSAYLCLNRTTGRVYTSRHVQFVENTYPFTKPTLDPFTNLEESNNHSITTTVPSPPFVQLPSVPPPTRDPHQPPPSQPAPSPSPLSPPSMSSPVMTSSPQFSSNRDSTTLHGDYSHVDYGLSSPSNPPGPITSPTTSKSPSEPTSSPSHSNQPNKTPPNSPSSSSSSPTPIPSPSPQSSNSPPPPPQNQHSMRTRAKNNITKPIKKLTLAATPKGKSKIPTTVAEALRDPNWRNAMSEEFNAGLRNSTYDLVPPKPHQNFVGTRWIFTIKYNPDGSINRYKARFLAKGFHQQHGLDYSNTFSPVIKSTTVQTVLDIAVSRSWDIRQLDINNAFLQGRLTEDVYVAQPPGFINPDRPNYVCHLKKALHGLKQAPRAWYQELRGFLLTCGFTNSVANTSLFIRQHNKDYIYILVYVDDFLITGSNSNLIAQFITCLANRFSLKDLGQLSYFLEIEATRTKAGLHLMQRRYVLDLLTKTKMLDAKTVSTPMSPTPKLTLTSGTPIDNPGGYRQILGSL